MFLVQSAFDVSLHRDRLAITNVFAGLGVRKIVVKDFYTRARTILRQAEKKCSVLVTTSII